MNFSLENGLRLGFVSEARGGTAGQPSWEDGVGVVGTINDCLNQLVPPTPGRVASGGGGRWEVKGVTNLESQILDGCHCGRGLAWRIP